MQIRIESFKKNTDMTKSTLVGWAKAWINDKFFVWMAVLVGKEGQTYCKFPTSRVGSEFVPSFGFTDNAKEKEISSLVKQELQKNYLNGQLEADF